jgi:hypothetical protein
MRSCRCDGILPRCSSFRAEDPQGGSADEADAGPRPRPADAARPLSPGLTGRAAGSPLRASRGQAGTAAAKAPPSSGVIAISRIDSAVPPNIVRCASPRRTARQTARQTRLRSRQPRTVSRSSCRPAPPALDEGHRALRGRPSLSPRQPLDGILMHPQPAGSLMGQKRKQGWPRKSISRR